MNNLKKKSSKKNETKDEENKKRVSFPVHGQDPSCPAFATAMVWNHHSNRPRFQLFFCCCNLQLWPLVNIPTRTLLQWIKIQCETFLPRTCNRPASLTPHRHPFRCCCLHRHHRHLSFHSFHFFSFFVPELRPQWSVHPFPFYCHPPFGTWTVSLLGHPCGCSGLLSPTWLGPLFLLGWTSSQWWFAVLLFSFLTPPKTFWQQPPMKNENADDGQRNVAHLSPPQFFFFSLAFLISINSKRQTNVHN